MERKRIGLSEVRSLRPGGIVWDTAVPGFGARRQRGAAVAYFLKYRTREGRQRWHTIGRHGGPWSPDGARQEARRILGEVVQGVDPAAGKRGARNAQNVAQLCDLYLVDAEAGRVLTRDRTPKKASTLTIDKGRIERHIKPLLGNLAVASVTRDDVERFMYDVADGKTAVRAKTARKRGLARVTGGQTAATRAVGLLGAIFSYSVHRGVRTDNPAHGIRRFADRSRDRRLGEEEYAALGAALRQAEAEGTWPSAIAASRFLALSGWRTNEVVALRRTEVDLARRTAILADSKTGRSTRPLPHAACDVLRGQIRSGGEKFFPASRGDGETLLHLKKFLPRIVRLAGLSRDVTAHVLRHSFISVAADLGYSEATIAALVGHKGRSVTSRYAHAADAVLLAAADAIANRTAELMGDGNIEPTVVALRRGAAE
jgi:integrase